MINGAFGKWLIELKSGILFRFFYHFSNICETLFRSVVYVLIEIFFHVIVKKQQVYYSIDRASAFAGSAVFMEKGAGPKQFFALVR